MHALDLDRIESRIEDALVDCTRANDTPAAESRRERALRAARRDLLAAMGWDAETSAAGDQYPVGLSDLLRIARADLLLSSPLTLTIANRIGA
jgi:hypothetical protein